MLDVSPIDRPQSLKDLAYQRIRASLLRGQLDPDSVYSAAHPVIGKRAAVKVLAPALASDPEVVRRFIDEARVVNKIGHRGLSYFGLPLQSLILMLVPLFTGFGPILIVYVASGFMRAIVVVANAVGLVEDVPESRVRRGLASGVYNAAGDLGNILGPVIGGFIAHATGIASVFVIGSLGSTALFLLGVLFVRRISKNGDNPPAL